ncbi:hypothetical protein E5288_WYG008555 [Bos mutus]|uniref:Uncharacterized protein n=1 Tax=Bos mutus TaxID=72004 RepID=A0A6B0S3X9_9CETA|nr:hypothetical protein [Bos mutus]
MPTNKLQAKPFGNADLMHDASLIGTLSNGFQRRFRRECGEHWALRPQEAEFEITVEGNSPKDAPLLHQMERDYWSNYTRKNTFNPEFFTLKSLPRSYLSCFQIHNHGAEDGETWQRNQSSLADFVLEGLFDDSLAHLFLFSLTTVVFLIAAFECGASFPG